MSRTAIPFAVDDLSTFAKALRQSLKQRETLPSHVELLNLIAKAAGFQNYQHLRADSAIADRLVIASAPAQRANLAQVEKAARYFDQQGVMARWPSQHSLQLLCLWVLWSRIPRGTSFAESQISDLIRDWHGFGDHALIRRTMVDARMLERSADGHAYRRVERAPPPELAPLLGYLNERQRVLAG
jgi:hypothetical protein